MPQNPSQDAFQASSSYFKNPLQEFQFYDKYSRYDYDLGRRETWPETVRRAVQFLRETAPQAASFDPTIWERVEDAILTQQVMPSMRLLATAGPAARRNNLAIYNCSYLPIRDIEAFGEALLLSMNGCGVGFSVERENVWQLPKIEWSRNKTLVWTMGDTTEAWQKCLVESLKLMWAGYTVEWDTQRVRPAGSPLKTKGGVASGPEPFVAAMNEMQEIIRQRRAHGTLRPIDAYDLMCLVGSAAVSGGHRRTAMIALFDATDTEMLNAKPDGFWDEYPWRQNANNSVVWTDTPTEAQFLSQMAQLFGNGTGEPGIFSRAVANATIPVRRSQRSDWGTNPCAEIVLQPYQLCNLSAVVCKSDDTMESLYQKVGLAAFIGTVQSMLTHFPGMRPEWKQHCEEERLLGVDLTGQLDCPFVQDPVVMECLREWAVKQNAYWAASLGINQAAAVTCVKPSGNSAQLLGCSSGLHARWSPYYTRNVRVSAHGPVAKVLEASGVKLVPDVNESPTKPNVLVVGFPVKAPAQAITRVQRSAIQQCDYWLQNKLYWTEHNPSVTITYKPDEVMGLVVWLWEHRDKLSGMAFLPAFDSVLPLLPYQEIDSLSYRLKQEMFPRIRWELLPQFEHTDESQAGQQMACESDLCLLTAGA